MIEGQPVALFSVKYKSERPEVLDKGTVVMGGITTKDISQALEMVVFVCDNHEKTRKDIG